VKEQQQQQQQQQQQFIEFPEEVLENIFQYLYDPFDICAIAGTCSTFYRLINFKRRRIGGRSEFEARINLSAYPLDRPSLFHHHKKYQSDFKRDYSERDHTPRFSRLTLHLVNQLNVRSLNDPSQIKSIHSKNPVKLHLGGCGGIGKTTFMLTYQYGKFPNHEYIPSVFGLFFICFFLNFTFNSFRLVD
jgi:hypothetical protein